jgi:uncharacterized protein (TIGR03435 family)
MIPNLASKANFIRKLLLTTIGIAAIGGFLLFGLPNIPQARAQSPQAAGAQAGETASAQSTRTTGTPSPSFEVASIKPNRSGDMFIRIMFQPGRFTANGVTTKHLITMAYNVKDFQVSGGPGWINSERYDIEAKEPDSIAEELPKLPPDQREEQSRLMIQALLADRFKLKLSHTTKELPVYALVIAKTGPKLQEAKPDDNYPTGMKGPDGRAHPGMMRMSPGELTGQGIGVKFLVRLLSQQVGRDVLDQTGLKGNYDFTLKWTPEPGEGMMLGGAEGGNPPPESAPPPESSGPSIFTAIQEQLGLKLEPAKGPVEVLVIDHVEKPSEN